MKLVKGCHPTLIRGHQILEIVRARLEEIRYEKARMDANHEEALEDDRIRSQRVKIQDPLALIFWLGVLTTLSTLAYAAVVMFR